MRFVHIVFLFLVGVSASSICPTAAFSATSSIRSLIATHEGGINSLKEVAAAQIPPDVKSKDAILPNNDVFYLRYILEPSYANDEDRVAAMKSNLRWRMNEGNSIVTNAHAAIQAATRSENGIWDNDPVRNAAPHANLINSYISPTQCITTTLPSTKDLVYCIRAGKIDDAGLMSTVTVDQMVDFFLYCKEVNAMVADIRSLEADSLVKVITCNDLSGVKLIGGSSDFRSSLSAASKKANELYPSLNGRTLLLNLPPLLGALVTLFKPLIPKAVWKRIRFENGPLKEVEDLREIVEGGSGRAAFVKEVGALAYGE